MTAVTNNVISGGSGDITDVWTATSGNVNALTAASGDTLDAGSADSTRPNKTGTTAPGTCSVGDTFFDSDATAGNNVYGCTATNTWTLEGDGGGAGAGDITDVWNTTSGNVNALTAASGDSLDASGADTTKACKTGTSPPGTCSQGECFVDTDAAAAAQLLICTATNTWTAQGNAVTVLTGAGTSALTGGATTDFVPISGFAAVTQTDGTNALRMPAGTFTALGCALSSTMSTGTYTIALRKNGVDQSVTFPITVQTGSDTAHSFSTSNNDNVSVSIVPSSSPTTGLLIKCWSKFSPS